MVLQGSERRPEGDTRPASPSLKVALAGGPTRDRAGAGEAGAIATRGSGQKRGCREPWGHVPCGREERLAARVSRF